MVEFEQQMQPSPETGLPGQSPLLWSDHLGQTSVPCILPHDYDRRLNWVPRHTRATFRPALPRP